MTVMYETSISKCSSGHECESLIVRTCDESDIIYYDALCYDLIVVQLQHFEINAHYAS